MGDPANGAYVSRAELAAHVKGIDEHFDQLEADVVEIKLGIHGIGEALRRERAQKDDDRKASRRAWGPAVVSAVVAALVSGALSLVGYAIFN